MARLLVLLSLLLIAGCGGPAEVAAQAPAPPAAETPAGPVTRVVFIGQAEACACTTERIAKVTAAFTAALGGRELTVEHLLVDRADDRDAVEMYREMRGFVVAPALFFFDAEDHLVQMTQGEVGQEELRQILGPESAPAAR